MSNPTTPYLIPSWILIAAGILTAAGNLRRRRAGTDRSFTAARLARDTALPIGMSLFGIRTLIIGYLDAPPQGALSRLLLFLATLGIVAGLALGRIRVRPGCILLACMTAIGSGTAGAIGSPALATGLPSQTSTGAITRVDPGSLWVLAIPRGDENAARVTLLGETHPMFARDLKWVAPLAIYARTRPGRYTAVVRTGGRILASVPFQVTSKQFPKQSITMKPSKSKLTSPEILRKERRILEAAYERTAPGPLWNGAFHSPLPGARISSDFGRTRYVNGRFWSQHGGIDFAAPTGKITTAGNDGRVILAKKLWMRGNTLAIDHGMGVISVYNHLSAFLVKEGDAVVKGQSVARVGATGFVTGPHLHWEIRAAGTPVNPWPILKYGIPLP